MTNEELTTIVRIAKHSKLDIASTMFGGVKIVRIKDPQGDARNFQWDSQHDSFGDFIDELAQFHYDRGYSVDRK